jgi:hypothetical protein
MRDVEAASRNTGLQIRVLNVGTSHETDAAFASFVNEKPDALFIGSATSLLDRRVQLALLAAVHRVPATYPWRDFVEAGGLMSYGASLRDAYSQIGSIGCGQSRNWWTERQSNGPQGRDGARFQNRSWVKSTTADRLHPRELGYPSCHERISPLCKSIDSPTPPSRSSGGFIIPTTPCAPECMWTCRTSTVCLLPRR